MGTFESANAPNASSSGIGAVHTWLHIAMRMQHTAQAASGLATGSPDRVKAKAVIVTEVERLRWLIWNGKAGNA